MNSNFFEDAHKVAVKTRQASYTGWLSLQLGKPIESVPIKQRSITQISTALLVTFCCFISLFIASMEKNEYLLHKNSKDSVDATSEDLPPPYEAVVESSTSRTPSSKTADVQLLSRLDRPKVHFGLPGKPLLLFTPNPERIKCQCGRHVDTTRRNFLLPKDKARCACGYIVTSSGYSSHPSQCRDISEGSGKECSCGTSLMEHVCKENTFVCTCGAVFSSDRSVRRICEYHQIFSNDAQNVPCDCGRYVDTTIEWRIRHGRNNVGKGVDADHALNGYTTFDYTLPECSGRCVCGMTVRRNGNCVLEHKNECCRIKSSSEKETVFGSEESCTCCYF